jgi:hypothetical protein
VAKRRSESLSGYLLRGAVTDSGRRSTVQLAEEFARTTNATMENTPDLARLLRMGEVALKLYLTLVMMTRAGDPEKPAAPHELHRVIPPSHFAEMLGYEELDMNNPVTGAGTRRVQRALTCLEKEGLVVLTKRPRHHANISVVHPGPGGDPVVPYITLPIELWSREWITHLSARALAVYVALRLASVGKKQGEGQVVDPYERGRFEFSDDTWQRGSKDLIEQGLLEVRTGVVESRRLRERHRNIYYLNYDRMLFERPADPVSPITVFASD